MINVVGDADILAEELLAHAFVEAGAFVRERGGCEIVEEKADEIEHGGGFEDDRVMAGGKLVGVEGEMCFFTDSRGEFQGVKGANVGRVSFGPTRRGAFLHGDGKPGVRLAVSRK